MTDDGHPYEHYRYVFEGYKYIAFKRTTDARLYYCPNDLVFTAGLNYNELANLPAVGLKNGFEFALFQICTNTCEVERESPEAWAKDSESTFNLIFHGTAYYDGVRHLNFTEGGYIFYPEYDMIIEGFEILQKLEKEYGS